MLVAIKHVFASLYNDRAISYRVHKGFAHAEVALSAGVQRMVRSDTGAAGVMFSLDTESGFRDVVFVTSSYGLGEMVVQGAVNPDEFYVAKVFGGEQTGGVAARTGNQSGKDDLRQCNQRGQVSGEATRGPGRARTVSLNDAEVEELARYAVAIEKHYGAPMDIEVGQGRRRRQALHPASATGNGEIARVAHRYADTISIEIRRRKIAEGRAIGGKVGSGPARVIANVDEISQFRDGDVIVTDMTDPNWEPVMKRAAAIVTNRGGRTCHAAIIARELGVPAVVGCENATEVIRDGEELTVACCEGDTGNIYRGKVPFEVQTLSLANMPDIPVKIAMNVGNPELAFDFAQLPNEGVGLARLEFIISTPSACTRKHVWNTTSCPRI